MVPAEMEEVHLQRRREGIGLYQQAIQQPLLVVQLPAAQLGPRRLVLAQAAAELVLVDKDPTVMRTPEQVVIIHLRHNHQ
jgi:hypothetical protein